MKGRFWAALFLAVVACDPLAHAEDLSGRIKKAIERRVPRLMLSPVRSDDEAETYLIETTVAQFEFRMASSFVDSVILNVAVLQVE